MKILLVNDDGVDSPALVPTINEMKKIGSVTTMVPLYQQSWTSKSNIRRGKDLEYKVIEREGHEIHVIDALPADCTNFGLYLNSDFPDLVISGANVGHNVGLAAFFSSGTIGAALEGLIYGVPSVAISVPYPRRAQLSTKEFAKSLEGISKLVLIFKEKREPNFAMMNLNIPYGMISKPLKPAFIEKFAFGPLFKKINNTLQPVNYLELNYPKVNELTEGSDAWLRSQSIASLVVLDSFGQFVELEKVKDWIEKYTLTTI